MAHSPEHPKRYACTECQVLHVGTVVERTESGHTFDPPAECGACGHTEFVGEVDWVHRHD